MSHFLDRLTFFNRVVDDFADGHGIVTREDRRWEDGYRKRWQHDKIVRSTHGANCTGSCSWKIYVKGGIVTWETQQTDYPRTRPDLPNHEPRGCSRGASYSWYLYSGNRVKYPLVRSRLLKLWREARTLRDAGRGLELDRRGSGQARRLHEEARSRRLRARDLGRGHGNHRGGQRLYGDDLWARPRRRLLADPGDVDGQLRRRLALPLAARRRLHVVLRLVLRPAAFVAADLGRADRRAGERRLVQFRLPDPVGLQRPADAHARRALLYRGALSRRQERRHLPGLFGSLEVRRSLDLGEAGHRRRARAGHGPRDPARVPHRPAGQVFRRLRPAVHRHADAGPARPAGRQAGGGPAAARVRFRRRARREQQSRLEDGRL